MLYAGERKSAHGRTVTFSREHIITYILLYFYIRFSTSNNEISLANASAKPSSSDLV